MINTIRYIIALIVILSVPISYLLWLAIHPFAPFWRKFGPIWTYVILGIPAALIMLLFFLYRDSLLAVEYGTNIILMVLGILFFITSMLMSIRRRKHLTFGILSGIPELSDKQYPGKLLTNGFYSKVRHPRYIEAFLATAGYVLFANYLTPYIILLASIPITYLIVILEERELRQRFGAEYEAYCQSVPRFFPRGNKMKFRKSITMIIIPFIFCSCTKTVLLPSGVQSQQMLKKKVTKLIQVNYLLYLPSAYEKQDKNWPLMLFLHGAGERGTNINLVKTHGPPKLIASGEHFPFIVVSPQCPRGQRWSIFELDALINEICERYRVDKDRIYVTGLSMGGYGTWNLAQKFPHRFAAIAPICGAGDPEMAYVIKDLPIWIFHGAKDKTVPIARSQQMVDALKKAGANVKFTVYPEAGHDSWTMTYENPELYNWFLQHKRTSD
jgi:protein-S-isoprenylcysteine O-methyltransferase Ste14/predicted esterase